MELAGLEEVKEQVLAIKAKVDICEYQGTSLERERFNVVFQGNPGTGNIRPNDQYQPFSDLVSRKNNRCSYLCGVFKVSESFEIWEIA